MQKIFIALSKFCFPWRDYTFKAYRVEDGFKEGDTGRRGFICIIKLFNENVFGEEVLGKKDRENGEQLIL